VSDPIWGRETSWRWSIALAIAVMAFIRLSGVRWAPGSDSPGIFADIATDSGLLNTVADLAATAIFCAVGLAMLIGPRGFPSQVRPDGVSLLPAAISLCAGGGAVSGAMATAVGGWGLGLEVGLIVGVCIAIAGAATAAAGAALVFVGLRLYELFER
jgi:hypothetical protein